MAWRRWRCGCPRTCGLRGWARCSGAKQTKRNVFSQELEKWEKESCSKLCWLSWLIRKIQISYKLKYDNNNNIFSVQWTYCYFILHLYCVLPIDLSLTQLQPSGVASNLKCHSLDVGYFSTHSNFKQRRASISPLLGDV